MKNPLRKLNLFQFLTRTKIRLKDYSLVAETLEEFVLRQERFIHRVSWRSELSPETIRSLIHESTTILTFSTLLGFDLGGLKGAAIGSAVGAFIVVGNIVFRVIFVRKKEGIELQIFKAA